MAKLVFRLTDSVYRTVRQRQNVGGRELIGETLLQTGDEWQVVRDQSIFLHSDSLFSTHERMPILSYISIAFAR